MKLSVTVLVTLTLTYLGIQITKIYETVEEYTIASQIKHYLKERKQTDLATNLLKDDNVELGDVNLETE